MNKAQGGQALITLIFFVLIAVTITSGAIIMIAVNTLSLTKFQEGTISYYNSESGIEEGVLRALRDPSYSGETLNIGGAAVTIAVTGSNPKIITAVSGNGNFTRKIQVSLNHAGGYYTISNWKEI